MGQIMLTLLPMLPATIDVTAVAADWSESDELELQAQEAKIERGIQSVFEMGAALEVINSKKLYRKTHRRYEDYLKDRWALDRRYAYRIEFAHSARNALSGVANWPQELLPSNECQVRALSELEDEQDYPRAWGRAIELNEGRQPHGHHVQRAVAEIKGKVTPLSSHQRKSKPSSDELQKWQASHALERDRVIYLESLLKRIVSHYGTSGGIPASLLSEASETVGMGAAIAG